MPTGRTTDSGPVSLTTAGAAQSLLAVDFEADDNQAGDDAQERPEETELDEQETDEGEETEGEESDAEEEDSEELDSDEGEAESEDDEDDGEAEDEEPEEPRYKIKVDGEEVEVTLSELQSGYSRDADYRRKTQALAEQRKTVEQELEQARQERQQYAQNLQYLQQQMQSLQEPEPDWNKLEREDPVGYAVQREKWREKREKQQALVAEQQRLTQRQQQEQERYAEQQLVAERERLLEAVPEWKDPEAMKADRERIIRTGKSLGFTEKDLEQVYDHRALVALRKAALYDDLMEKQKTVGQRKKPPATRTKTSTPGTTKSKQQVQSSAVKRKKQRFAKSRSVKDAAGLIADYIED